MPAQTRQLAAIMFTDIVGYTALMGEDEQKAFELLKKNRLIQRPIIEEHNGRWLKEIGDGVLASFNAVSDAVYCAKAIQKACENEPDLKLRIGIHEGEVVFEGNDVFGDGVNIASRLEPLAPIGGILVSESVQRNLGNKQGIETNFVREEQLKNVKEPVKIYSIQVEGVEPVAIPGLFAPPQHVSTKFMNPRKMALAVVGILLILLLSYFLYSKLNIGAQVETQEVSLDKSIVVLPFVDMSVNKNQEHFSDGMMEEIRSHLIKIKDLKVVSRTTAMKYKGTNKTTKEIAKELGVATVLEGSVRKEGDRVQITVGLIEGTSNMSLFSESYDRQLNSIFEVQSDVAQLVANALKAQISPEVRLRIEEIPTRNPRAYELYLKGREQHHLFWSEFDVTLVHNGIEYYNQALAIDPGFSNAYAGLGQSYWMLAHYSSDHDPAHWELSKTNLRKAIEIDPGNGWAYAELGVVQHNWDWDKKAAIESFQKAIELNPADAGIHNHFSIFYYRIGDCEGAETEARISNSLHNIHYDPKLDLWSLICRRNLGQISKLNPDNLIDFYKLASLMFQGQYQKVVHYVNEATLNDGELYQMTNLGEAYALIGDSVAAVNIIKELNELSDNRHVPVSYIAPIYMALGDHEMAFQLLEEALNKREWQIHILTFQFLSIYRIQDDPRYISLMERSWIPKE